MADQHGTQPEHHIPVPEKEFYDRARKRFDEILQNIAELEQRMEAGLGRGLEGKGRSAD